MGRNFESGARVGPRSPRCGRGQPGVRSIGSPFRSLRSVKRDLRSGRTAGIADQAKCGPQPVVSSAVTENRPDRYTGASILRRNSTSPRTVVNLCFIKLVAHWVNSMP